MKLIATDSGAIQSFHRKLRGPSAVCTVRAPYGRTPPSKWNGKGVLFLLRWGYRSLVQ